MSSLAQEESRSISENTTWGRRKAFADGNYSLPWKSFYGYDKGEDGKPAINEEQAEVIRLIYKMFLEGYSAQAIANVLFDKGIKSPMGKDRWNTYNIMYILQNEKMCGDALLQKKYTESFLTKKQIKNNGEIPQYLVEDDHEGIIDKRTWELVQAEVQRRKGKHYSGVSIFSSKIICGECGGYYGSKVWHSTDKYRRVIWRCNHKYRGGKKCETPHLTEDEIKEKFVKANDKQMEEFITELQNLDGAVTEFDENLWSSLVDHVTVMKGAGVQWTPLGGAEKHRPSREARKKLVFTFKGGTEITV